MSFPQETKVPVTNSPIPAGPLGSCGKATASLILGIVSCVGTCFTGVIGLVLGILALREISKSNGRLRGKGVATAGIVLSGLGILWALILVPTMLLPAIQQFRTTARQSTSKNLTRLQILAMKSYELDNKAFPPMGKDGLSWRVHILPYLGEEHLYSHFHLDEPWDSPHNIELLDHMPQVFEAPSVVIPSGFTVYQVPYTDINSNPKLENAAMFDNSGQDIGYGEITDGTSNTIAIVEVNASAAVQWTRPADWEFAPLDPLHDLGANWPDGDVVIALGDGTVHTININNVDSQVIRNLISRNDGNFQIQEY